MGNAVSARLFQVWGIRPFSAISPKSENMHCKRWKPGLCANVCPEEGKAPVKAFGSYDFKVGANGKRFQGGESLLSTYPPKNEKQSEKPS